ncbi:MAG: methylated-DNA--[protein]-cysteine S-methyltransferase [Methylomicrobium sp.]|nr:methylated-DNA--[protein]-cysteine S-methyltransferase [Methylomicrobium sp.]
MTDKKLKALSGLWQSFEVNLSYWRDPVAVIELKLLRRGSSFFQKIQNELLKIPFSKTLIYKTLAKNIGLAHRAVGGACRRNDYPLIVTCHPFVSVAGQGVIRGKDKEN